MSFPLSTPEPVAVQETTILTIRSGDFDALSGHLHALFTLQVPRYKLALDNVLITQGIAPDSRYITLSTGYQIVQGERDFYVTRRFTPSDLADAFRVDVRPCGHPDSEHSWNVLAYVSEAEPEALPKHFDTCIKRFLPSRNVPGIGRYSA